MKNSETAFPVLDSMSDGNGNRRLECISSGMSLRDYFAGQALAGLLISDCFPEDDSRTLRNVSWVTQYDSATGLNNAPRNPIECVPDMPGG